MNELGKRAPPAGDLLALFGAREPAGRTRSTNCPKCTAHSQASPIVCRIEPTAGSFFQARQSEAVRKEIDSPANQRLVCSAFLPFRLRWYYYTVQRSRSDKDVRHNTAIRTHKLAPPIPAKIRQGNGSMCHTCLCYPAIGCRTFCPYRTCRPGMLRGRMADQSQR